VGRRKKTLQELEISGADVNHPERMKGRESDAKTRPSAGGEDVLNMPMPAPKWLKPAAAKIWDEIAPDLVATGRFRPPEVEMLCTYCCLEAEFQKAPYKMQTSRLALKERYAVKLQLIQARGAASAGTKKKSEDPDPAEKYFDDGKPN
jgi:phage terminase small subunit